ncbi:phage gp6-like head-tail connector protein (plasmid) [Herbaspirillum seropedicae]|uniref:head-tail connector protein n=1 Tax=Herbaspirillum seropedicae TaxID=964 RepID=UPI001120F3BE|nr:head-tail connector protein [Herbaspirillum seropedicae]QDD62651.1 phage gp6-like head-tail connector protein [Herbaspirillum seropedicae]
MPVGSNDLTTLANVKQWLGLDASSTDDDELLQRLITAVSGYVQTWLNRTFLISPYVETLDGKGKSRMMCANYPITAVDSVVINGQAIGPSPDIHSPGYYFDDYMIGLRSYCFSRGESNVVLAYHAGFASVPPEIEQACIEVIALRYSEKSRVGYSSKTLAGETIAFTITDFPASVQTVLGNYKKVVPLS